MNFDTNNVDRQPGIQRARGVELSLSGEIVPNLNIAMSASLGEVKIIGPNLAGVGRDFAVQATIPNVLENNRLIAEVAREAGVASPPLALDPSASDAHSYAWLFSPLVRKMTFGNITFPTPAGGNNLLKHHS